MQLTLTPDQASMLHEILASYLSDLRMEISNTDSMDFRERLKAKEVFLKGLLDQLSA
ncbi:MAG TPA: hypothetical protein VK845_02050 [Gemmatimonadales bacterium]|nr:hypothetical protein [Gemmatimonadales bacterium]